MKTYKILALAIAAGSASLGGCLAVGTPAVGVVYTDVKYGDVATTATATPKTGTACAESILGMFATGDASIEAAKANGGITEVASVDHTAHSVLGIYGEWCTVVKGR